MYFAIFVREQNTKSYPMKVFDICGQFDPAASNVKLKMMLPDLKHGGNYALDQDFYNLSVVDSAGDTFYFILGVLKVNGETIQDLANYKTDAITLKTLSHCDVSLTSVKDPLKVNIDLAAATAQDTIYGLVIHKDDFDIDSGGLDTLAIIKNNILPNLSSLNYAAMVQPPKGGGGPAIISGCQF